ncbi:unnamed protein product [Chrysodeixis includens]|uniref:Uncharacterized protein n=1 Tax=Chrysodeixis includens TaxID=689277 RepID=A0A9P0BRZ1_CHRIL|nr:unnamed protein product [Chrysodeixis includens]
MDDSQSSDFLSESTDIFCNSPIEEATMDGDTYKSLVTSTKFAFSSIRKDIKNTSFSMKFSTLLEDCSACITQSLDLITDLLTGTGFKQNILVEYMNNVVCLLQSLSDLIKNVIESISMACCSMKTFPTVTGQIIKLVFTHCKDSESLYGNKLNYVEQQLKDLFRSCHELQLTYLMVLEKHIIFDLTEKEEQDILTSALDINLKIGEIVQSLDVKTMAEQWKAYTMICEKYSHCLKNKRIYSDCTKILCSVVTSNINTALQENQEDKIALRSLKVSSFTIKILVRVCNTFRQASIKDHQSIVELLLYVFVNNEAYLLTMAGKSLQFINLFNNNVSSPVNSLLAELLVDEHFVDCICNYNANKIERDDKLLGLILLVIAVIRILLQKHADESLNVPKYKLINAVYSLLPYCYVWFNMGLRFKCDKPSRQYQTYGLYEYVLTHTVALSAICNAEEIQLLENKMMEAILSTECSSAMFSSNLWLLIARICTRQYLQKVVVSLCELYQKLEMTKSFADSPQRVHLSHTISALFETMVNEDKMKLYSMFSIYENKNLSLWRCLKLYNLPNEAQMNAEDVVLDKFRTQIQNLTATENTEDINCLINTIHLASTCSLVNREEEMESLFIEAWMKACPKNTQHLVKSLDAGTLWYYRYIEALVQLTDSMEHVFHGRSTNVIKVLHSVSNIVQSGYKELKLLLINILCKLANFETSVMNKHVADSILTQTFSKLFQDTDLNVKNKLFIMLRKYRTDVLDGIVSAIADGHESLRDTWDCFITHGRLNRENVQLKDQLFHVSNFKYCHKCIENVVAINSGSVTIQKSVSNNFDFIDIDSLFDADSDAEPACKKAKLNSNEVELIISRLEHDVTSLHEASLIKENTFSFEHKNRIKIVCNTLNNIID